MLSYYITSKFHFLQLQQAPVAQWIERLFPKQKVVGSTPTWRDVLIIYFAHFVHPYEPRSALAAAARTITDFKLHFHSTLFSHFFPLK
jgi:hypothetical protein